jgi:hypothetical protein
VARYRSLHPPPPTKPALQNIQMHKIQTYPFDTMNQLQIGADLRLICVGIENGTGSVAAALMEGARWSQLTTADFASKKMLPICSSKTLKLDYPV